MRRIAHAVAEAAVSLQSRQPRWTSFLDRLHGMSLEISAAGVVTMGTSFRRSEHLGDVAREHLRGVLADAASLARQQKRGGLLLTLDEVQDAPRSELSTIVHAIQDVTGEGHSLLIMAAGLPHTPETLMEAASFTERFRYAPLAQLSPDDALLALTQPAHQLGVRWEAQASQFILSQTQGSPYLLQLYGNETWHAAAPTGPGTSQLRHAQQGAAAAETELQQGLFRGRWNSASESQQRFLAAI